MSGKNKVSLICALALASLFMALNPSSAKLAVKPLSFILEMTPGTTRTKVLTVTNTGKEEVKVFLKVVDWFRTPEGNLQILPPGSRDRSCADWIRFSPSNFTLEPNNSTDVTIEVTTPPTGLEGDYWATLLVTEKSENKKREGEPVTMGMSLGYAIKILVKDPQMTKKSGAITNISLEKVDPLTLNVEFKNNGKTHLHTTGTVALRNLQGGTVESFPVGEVPVLPGEVRELKLIANSDNNLKQGQYYAIAVFDYGGEYRVQGGRPIFLSMPFGSFDAPPRDLDGDDLYEDINGDRKITSNDSSALALNLDAEVVKNSPSFFDFNNDGKVSFADASKLLEMVEQKKQKE